MRSESQSCAGREEAFAHVPVLFEAGTSLCFLGLVCITHRFLNMSVTGAPLFWVVVYPDSLQRREFLRHMRAKQKQSQFLARNPPNPMGSPRISPILNPRTPGKAERFGPGAGSHEALRLVAKFGRCLGELVLIVRGTMEKSTKYNLLGYLYRG